MRRVRCPDCGVRVEAVPFARPRARHTRDFENLTAFLAKQMAKTPIAASWRPTTPYRRRHGQRTVYYPVVDGEGEVPALRPRGEGRDLRVGFLGRIDPKKNLDLLIDSMAQLPDHVRLVIAGDGPADLIYSLRRRAAGLGVSGRLEWLGFVEPGDRTRFLENVDLLAMPSAFESFGLSAAEAMLHGVPVLVSERTGIAEVISRHGGGRITEAGASAIATAIGELDAERGALSRMGARGQAAVREELDSARIGRALRDAYTDAVG